MNYKKELVNAINQYDNSTETFDILKDIVCTISDKKIGFEEPLMKELVYIASQKLRTFGYNKLNKLDLFDIISDNNYSYLYKNIAINEFYTSDTGVLLDKNQKMIIELFESLQNKRLLVSAPTSFGKTFILKELIYLNRDRYKNIILIFPTISLLNENVDSFIDFLEKMNLKYNIVSNTHIDIDPYSNNIFILTPERVLKVLNDNRNLRCDFFFMDEIYKIDNFFNISNDGDILSENERDAVFRIVLYLLSKSVSEFYLAAPYLNLQNTGDGFLRFIKENNIETIQINTELVKKKHIISWNNQIIDNDISIDFDDNSKLGKMLSIIKNIKENNLGPTLVYAESISKVTKLSRELITLFDINENINLEVNDFINHLIGRYSYNYKGLKTHQMWSMIELLKRGIGTHHGAFPKYIQKEILDLFNKGYIKVLFTTTSITEGVNTKAKNLIFYGKSKGTKELKNFDIKNINGRAGRYYHYFIGRIFYLEQVVYNKMLNDEDQLDFITFSNKDLPGVDLDNVDKMDLTEKNASIKENRDQIIKSYNIDESVYIKNRLIDRIKQSELIVLLRSKSNAELRALVNQCSSIRRFLENKTIYKILEYFKTIDLIKEYEYITYSKIASDYARPNGIYELFKYHFDKCEFIDIDKVDSIYVTVFSNIRNIIEYKVPKYLSVFESLLKYVCSLPTKNIDTNRMALNSIIRFYELGVKTQFGALLAEYGFPITAIKNLEKDAISIMEKDIENILNNYSQYKSTLYKYLDNFETNLLDGIVRLASKH